MSTFAAGANSERTNRWLLIGAAVLAVVFGLLVFWVLANVGGDDANKKTSTPGDASVLVASSTIKANTKITADMLGTTSVSSSSLVPGAILEKDKSSAIGKVTRSDILKGEQVSDTRLGVVNGKNPDDLAFKIPEGKRAVAVGVNEDIAVGGFVVPGDHVDVIGIFSEKRNTGLDTTRVETVLQNVEVLAVAQTSLTSLPSKDASGTPVAAPDAQGTLGGRPTDTSPKPTAGTATLALTPQDLERLIAADAKGDIKLVLRPAGDDKTLNIDELNLDDFGFLGPLPRP